MISWIVIIILLYIVGLFLPPIIITLKEGILYAAGARDEPATDSILLGRARRAHENLKEPIWLFLALAILTMLPETGPTAQATTGAALYVIARVAYLPIYLAGIPWIRTLTFLAGLFGLILMLLSLL